ncbi:TIGR03618 family F420-dependent PPOX class oxidoreductase [Streptomyces avicenniae]|uniref:TIGR03618 family F420-dependent PPOX class oxidoreductase n=1 Tax=Streptomyces avicenniae TaxID=500153 RepID=UPI00069B2D53|nr:TIGR03618 family F420-dependent PPOX class oxidoreductase [Streptomyces avicenniae]
MSATTRPGPRPLTDEEASALIAAQRFSVLATTRRSGHPHLTTVVHSWDPATRTARVSTTEDRFKVRRIRADPRVALHVQGPDPLSFAVAEGEAEVSAPSTVEGDAIGRELLALAGEFVAPGEEQAFLAEQVAERRVVIRLRATRLFGVVLEVTAD